MMSILSLSLIVCLIISKRQTVYSSFCLGLSVLVGLFLLDTTVLIRVGDGVSHTLGFSLAAEYRRLIHGGALRWTEMLANFAVFVPFGLFLSEFLFTTKHFGLWRRIGHAILYAFGLSLLIESLQLILRLGVFEITDLVLNTLGGFVGALTSTGLRKVVGREVIDFRP